jgi:hypothetical protein
MYVQLNHIPKWFAMLVTYGLYLVMFFYIAYNIVQGFRDGKKRAELEEFKKRLDEIELSERLTEHFREHRK